MKQKNTDFFWPSYTDLMTSLFFIMLVLYVLTYLRLNKTIRLQKDKLAIIEAVEQNLKPLKSDSTLFAYEEEYKRFKLAFDVQFKWDKYNIDPAELDNYDETIAKIDSAGRHLMRIIDKLNQEKKTNPHLKDVSYIVVIAGYASISSTGQETHNYELSYHRALALRDHWKSIGVNFEAAKYKDLVDLQISGNGWGGVGRPKDETANQRFLIQIFPKIGDIK